MLTPWKESYDQPRHHTKEQRRYFADNGLSNQSYVFFPVVMYECESWTIKKAAAAAAKSLQSCLTSSTKELMLLNCHVGEDS